MPKEMKNTKEVGHLPETGFLRLPQVLAVFPVSKSTFWAMIREKRAPAPVRLSKRCVAWSASSIRELIESKGI